MEEGKGLPTQVGELGRERRVVRGWGTGKREEGGERGEGRVVRGWGTGKREEGGERLGRGWGNGELRN